MNTSSYLVELFNYRRNPGDLESYLKETLFPFLHGQEIRPRLFSSVYGLSPHHFWMITPAAGPGREDTRTNLCAGTPEGLNTVDRLQEEVTGHRSMYWNDTEPEISWKPDRRYPMVHCETFHAQKNPAVLHDFFLTTALPYLRERGFFVKFFYSSSCLWPAQFWFITGLESFSMLDRWANMASGEPKGREIMTRLLELIDLPRAAIIREIF